jgi:diadenosine tetraphosphate (Ap4A) HIT family hydrolase
MDLILKQSIYVLKQLDEVQKLYICSFGEETNHFHWHIFPRGMELGFNEQVIDGAKYFSEARKKYKVPEHEMLTSEKILRVVSYLQQRIEMVNGLWAEDRRAIET